LIKLKIINPMKNILIITLTFVCFFVGIPKIYAQENIKNAGFDLKINTNGLEGNQIYLLKRVGGVFEITDSAKLNKTGITSIKGQLELPEILFLSIDNNQKYISVFAENSSITVVPDFDAPEKTQISGSSIQDDFNHYQAMISSFADGQKQLYAEYNEAKSQGDEEKINQIIAKSEELSEKETKLKIDYINTHTGSILSPMIIQRELLYSLSLEDLKDMVNSLDNSLNNSIYVKELNSRIDLLASVSIGKKYTDFELPTPEGEMLKLSDLVGENIILIDFWASWCGPCRRENPNVVATYNEFHDKGFEILGVSLDKDKDNWINAIKDDNLSWYHVSDLKYWNSAAAKLYAVNSIPHTVILDKNGVIIAKNLRGEALKEKLKELLN
jgi:peroxiredoxin